MCVLQLGVVCGVAVGVVYWPVVLPVCVVVVACYLTPLIYVSGRLLVGSRCACLSALPLPTDRAHASDGRADLADGVTSFETCCFLDDISGSSDRSANSKQAMAVTN